MSTSGVLELPTGRFHYLAYGDERAPVALCLHGFPDCASSWEPVLARLADAGYRAVAPWMRGYAPSVIRGPYHVDQLAEDAIAMAEALAGEHPVALIGHDWGAAAAYVACGIAPQRFACAVTMAVPHPLAFMRAIRRPAQLRRSWYMLFFQLPGMPERLVAARDYAFIDYLWRRWSPGYDLTGSLRRELIDCLRASMPAPLQYYRAIAQPVRAAMARLRASVDKVGRIEVPLLHLHGSDDGCVAPAAARGQERFFAGPFEMRVLDGLGHFLQLEDPDRVAGAIADWLEEFEPWTVTPPAA